MSGPVSTSSTTYRHAEGAATAEVDGDTVVLSPTDLRYHSLNTTAAAVWQLLAEPTTADEVVTSLVEIFDVDADTCRTDVEACLAELCEIGVVTAA